MLKKFKAVFFDAGGTLFHPYPSVGEIYRDVARRYGTDVKASQIESLFHEAWLTRDGLSHLNSHSSEKIEKDWWRSLVLEVFSQVAEIERFEDFFEELYDVFARPEVWHLYNDTLTALEALRRCGIEIGIVSNWDSRLFQLCEGLGLGRYVKFILASAVFGAAKPSPKIFQEALRLAGVEAHEAVHVGDSLVDDVQGALAAGIAAIFIDRKKSNRSQSHPSRDRFRAIHSLKELI